MDFEELLAPVAGEFDIAVGDLFMISADGTVKFLDTMLGTCERAASSVAEWEQRLRDPEQLDQWFMPAFVHLLREANVLAQGECYSPLHAPVLGGTYTVENWRAISWRVHFSHEGRMHYAIKDLPDGTAITQWHYTKL